MMFMVTLSLNTEFGTWSYATLLRGRGADNHEMGGGYATPEEALREALDSVNYSSAALPAKGSC
jgi:hypothetical protein